MTKGKGVELCPPKLDLFPWQYKKFKKWLFICFDFTVVLYRPIKYYLNLAWAWRLQKFSKGLTSNQMSCNFIHKLKCTWNYIFCTKIVGEKWRSTGSVLVNPGHKIICHTYISWIHSRWLVRKDNVMAIKIRCLVTKILTSSCIQQKLMFVK